jgi:drug/metabolite transporter (DMT)-like permease
VDIKLLVLILGSVTLSALAQLVFKLGMSSAAVQLALNQGHSLQTIWTVAINPSVIAGFVFYGLGAIVWLLVLSRVDVSLAYPFVGLGFVLVMFLGWLVLGEQVGPVRLVGTLFVVIGVWLVSSS